MPQNSNFVSTTSHLLVSQKNRRKDTFFLPYIPFPPVIFATATVVHLYYFAILLAFMLLNVHGGEMAY